jgi:hypothetical protein
VFLGLLKCGLSTKSALTAEKTILANQLKWAQPLIAFRYFLLSNIFNTSDRPVNHLLTYPWFSALQLLVFGIADL